MKKALLLSVLAAGCAAPPVVAVKPGYDFAKVGRVALIDFQDAPGQPGSGAAVSQELEPFLLKAGYDLIERGQVEKLLQEQAFSQSGAVDPATAESIGKLLGVNALILGRVTTAVQARSSTYLQTVQNVAYRPVYQTVQYQDREGKLRARQTIGQYDVVTTNDHIPQTYTTPATLAFAARLVDVATGQVLWTGSSSSDGDSMAAAAADACARLMKALKKAWPVRS